MKFTWRSRKTIDFSSVSWHESQSFSGVRFAIRQISVGSRIELLSRMRELLSKHEFLRSGDALDQTDAALSDLMARSTYLKWGLVTIDGLTIDGTSVSAEQLIEKGPECLSNEIIDTIRQSLELTDSERKNF